MNLEKATVRVLAQKNYGACYDFYTDKLGLVPVWGDRNGPYTSFAAPGKQQPCFAMFSAADMALFPGYAAPGGRAPADSLTVVVPCDDLDEAYRKLSEAGVAFMGKPTTMEGWGMRCVYLRDPEGNLFELNDAASV